MQVRTEESSKEAQEAEEARARAKLMKTKQVGHPGTPGLHSLHLRWQQHLILRRVAPLCCHPPQQQLQQNPCAVPAHGGCLAC